MTGGSRDPTVPTVPGSVVASRYVVVRELGRGGMATVLEVRDIRTDRRLALKILKPEIAAHSEAVERFRREGEFLSSLKHPALIAVESVGALPDGRLFLAMELLEGETLGERIRRGPISPIDVSPILAGAAVGLDAAHRAGVIHRDLKPDNVFLAVPPGGGPVQVKLLDFGISKIDGRSSLTRTGQVLGTPRYMAPEQLRGEHDLDPRVDIYALGVILYEALSGQPAFPAQQPSELIVAILNGRVTPLRAIRPDVPVDVEAVVMRAMARTREARFASAVELAQSWFDVVHRHDGPKGVRTGVGTSVFGTVGPSLRPPPMSDGDALRPATFREFEARLPKLADDPEGPPLSSLADDPGMRTPDVTAAATAPAPAPAREPVPAPAPSVSADSQPRPPASAPTVATPDDGAVAALPVKSTRRWWLACAALAAFGLLAFGAVTLRGRSTSSSSGRGEAPAIGFTAPVVPTIAASTTASADAGTSSTAVDAARPVAVVVPVTPNPASIDAGAPATRVPPSTTHESSHPRPTVSPGSALASQARSALAAGDARRCVELVTEAIAAGVDASAYRLRGDCYRALGDMPHALRSYQRFCALAPNSPHVDTVRRSAEALGGTCP